MKFFFFGHVFLSDSTRLIISRVEELSGRASRGRASCIFLGGLYMLGAGLSAAFSFWKGMKKGGEGLYFRRANQAGGLSL